MLCGKEEPREGKRELNDVSKLTTSSRETETFFNIAKHILVYMASKVSLNRDYAKSLANSPHPLLGVEKLGMGTSNTWHGIPGARIQA